MAESKSLVEYTKRYSNAMVSLIHASDDAKRAFKRDKPAIREAINNHADTLIKELPASMDDESKADFERLLSDFACTLHPRG